MSKRVNIEAHPSQMSLEQVDSNVLLELFPFAIILDHDMRITRTGEKLFETWIVQNPNRNPEQFFNSPVTKYFKLRRPKGILFNWKTVNQMHFVIFELELIRDAAAPKSNDGKMKKASNAVVSKEDEENARDATTTAKLATQRGAQSNYRLLLKGQMRYIADLDSIVFLCSPL